MKNETYSNLVDLKMDEVYENIQSNSAEEKEKVIAALQWLKNECVSKDDYIEFIKEVLTEKFGKNFADIIMFQAEKKQADYEINKI